MMGCGAPHGEGVRGSGYDGLPSESRAGNRPCVFCVEMEKR